MELTFTGRGAMLNPQEGNNAAFFEDDNNFFLIDCGEDVASKLIDMGKLTSSKDYYLLITHTHSDHIGSIGTLQQYLYWICGKKLKIVFGKEIEHDYEIMTILTSFGIVPGTYEIVDTSSLDNNFSLFKSIRYRKSNHGDVPIKSASIIINTNDGNILYTGDIADDEVIRSFLSENTKDSIDKMYIDTSLKKSPVHLSLEQLSKVIPKDLKEKVYCMHLDRKELIEEAHKLGFNIVSSSRINLINRDIDSLNEDELSELEIILKNKLSKIEEIKKSSSDKVYTKK